MTDINQHVGGLDLIEPSHVHLNRAFAVAPAALAIPEADIQANDGKQAGYVAKGSLVSFVAGVSGQSQSDVLNSTLLAQLAADKKFDRFSDPINWYTFYVEVLGEVGWALQGFSFEKYNASTTSFTVDKAVLEILGAIATGQEELVIAATLEALKGLSNDDGRLSLWNQSITSDKKSNFQVSVCNETNGVVAMKNAAFYLSSEDASTSVLWFNFSSSRTEFNKAAQPQTLNADVYGQVRQTIIAKLGANAKTFIADLDI